MFTIITDDNCPWCTKAKNLLNENNLSYKEIEVEDPCGLAIMTTLRLTKVPQIFYNDERIGGYTDLVEYLNDR